METSTKRRLSLPNDTNLIKKIKQNGDEKNDSLDKNLPLQTDLSSIIPENGTLVNRRVFRRVGEYILGPKLGYSPVDCVVHYLAKKENTNEFFQLKVIYEHFIYLFVYQETLLCIFILIIIIIIISYCL